MNKKIIGFIVLQMALYVFLRIIHLPERLNFMQDQAYDSITALRLIRENPITLIGPRIALEYEGRYLFQGPLISYVYAFLGQLTHFRPIQMTSLFIFLGALGVPFLYMGARLLTNTKSALLLIFFYVTLPYYIDYTSFLWNPNFQFAAMPFYIYCLGRYYQKNTKTRAFILGCAGGLMLQFHYQFVLILLTTYIVYFVFKKAQFKLWIFAIAGNIVGFLPIVIFEIRNQFYNTQTAWLFATHWQDSSSELDPARIQYYGLSISLLIAIYAIHKAAERAPRATLLGTLALCIFSVMTYISPPSTPFLATVNWKYLDNEKVYSIMRSQNKTDYNVTAPSFDNVSAVQKFLLKRDKVNGNFDDYYQNKYLYVIHTDENLSSFQAYEIASFYPRKLRQTWSINEDYKLYLYERI